MLSRGASSAAEYAKDITSQAGTKAAELSGTVSEKVTPEMCILFFVGEKSFSIK